ncbi:MAG: sulfurtransferase-like selenium metabolism protein YedF [Clostridioides sp.]|nr:sulfurtransferase-like selenium metabolism protein YedF [Clostridioides sp.]
MKVEVDARGLACPKPVINAKKELEKINEGTIEVIVDNQMARENLLKLADSMNLKSNVLKEEENYISIEIIKSGDSSKSSEETSCKKESDLGDRCIFITKETMGTGNDELGQVLIKGFVYALTESKPYPKSIMFVNGGVKLSTVNEDTVNNLKLLEKEGVEILSCGTCLDYYGLKEKLQVGTVTNMYTIVENLKNSSNTITI